MRSMDMHLHGKNGGVLEMKHIPYAFSLACTQVPCIINFFFPIYFLLAQTFFAFLHFFFAFLHFFFIFVYYFFQFFWDFLCFLRRRTLTNSILASTSSVFFPRCPGFPCKMLEIKLKIAWHELKKFYNDVSPSMNDAELASPQREVEVLNTLCMERVAAQVGSNSTNQKQFP